MAQDAGTRKYFPSEKGRPIVGLKGVGGYGVQQTRYVVVHGLAPLSGSRMPSSYVSIYNTRRRRHNTTRVSASSAQTGLGVAA